MSVLETLEICFTADLSEVTAQLTGLSSMLNGLSGQAVSAAGAMRAAGGTLAGALRQGLEGGLPSIQLQGRSAAQQYAAGAEAAASSAKRAGAQLSAGLAAGIRSGNSSVTAAVSAVVNNALAKMRSLLAIHSPSKVTRGLGGFFSEGFARGIRASAGLAAGAANQLGASALENLQRDAEGCVTPTVELGTLKKSAQMEVLPTMEFGKLPRMEIAAAVELEEWTKLPRMEIAPTVDLEGLAGLSETKIMPSAAMGQFANLSATEPSTMRASEEIHLTVPLYVDAMKLGEASIRGINAVTKSAGRVLLNI